MRLARPSSRWALWALAAALLLKGAMPFLASVSAQAQGKSLVEVCTVYGVATVQLDESGTAPTSQDHAAEHRTDHCALASFATLAEGASSAQPLRRVDSLEVPRPAMLPGRQAPDACADWAARLRHGPPLVS